MKTCSACQRCYDDSSRFCEDDKNSLDHARPGTCKVLNKYRLNALLHRDSVSETYRADDISADKPVVVKFISPNFGSNGQSLRESFLNEAQTAAEIDQSNIIRVYESGIFDDDELYTVTEAVDGKTLREYVREKGSLFASEAVLILRQLTDGLEAIHSSDIIHAALNPANIIVTFDENQQVTAKLGNFDFAGIAENAVTSDESMELYERWRLECLKYLSPEQCAGENVDARSDVYSLGVVLYELLSGHAPFEANTAQALIDKQINEQPQPLEHLPFGVDELLNRTLMLALEKNPSMRLSTSQFANHLRSVERLIPQSPLEEFLPLPEQIEEIKLVVKISPRQDKMPALLPALNLLTAEKPPEVQLAEEPVSLAISTPNLQTDEAAFSDYEIRIFETDAKEENSVPESEPVVLFNVDVEQASSDDEEPKSVPKTYSVQQVLHRVSSPHFTRIALGLAILPALVLLGALFSAWQSPQTPEIASVIATPLYHPEEPAQTAEQEEEVTDSTTENSDALPLLTVRRTPPAVALKIEEEKPEVKQHINLEEKTSAKKKVKDEANNVSFAPAKGKEIVNAYVGDLTKPRVVIRNVNHPNLVYDIRNQKHYQTRQCRMDVSQRQLSVLRNGGTDSILVTFENAADAEKLTVTTDNPAHISTALQPNKTTNRRTVRITSTSEITKTYTIFVKSPCGMQAVKVQVR